MTPIANVPADHDPFMDWPPAAPERENITSLLYDILVELKHLNNNERTGSVSSAELKFLANGTAQPIIKAYAGSVVPVRECIEAYTRLVQEANERQMRAWQGEVEAQLR